MSFLNKLLGREDEAGSVTQDAPEPETLATPEAIEKSFVDLAQEAENLPPEYRDWGARLIETVGAAHSLEISKAVKGEEAEAPEGEEPDGEDDEAAALATAPVTDEAPEGETLEGETPDGETPDGEPDGKEVEAPVAPVKVNKSVEAPPVQDATPILVEIAQSLRDLSPLVGEVKQLRKSLAESQQQIGAIQKSLGETQASLNDAQAINKSLHEFVQNRSASPAATPSGVVAAGAGVRILDINKSVEVPRGAVASGDGDDERFGITYDELSDGMFQAIAKSIGGLSTADLASLPNTPPQERPKEWYEAAAKALGRELSAE